MVSVYIHLWFSGLISEQPFPPTWEAPTGDLDLVRVTQATTVGSCMYIYLSRLKSHALWGMVKLRTVPWVQGVRYKQYTEYDGYSKNSTLGETRDVCPRYVLLVFCFFCKLPKENLNWLMTWWIDRWIEAIKNRTYLDGCCFLATLPDSLVLFSGTFLKKRTG